ncbi:ribonuclease P protein component [Engelhardtia mirabilis]|uniref:ribonuclease P protein component n=1 Tax=Engelhardtia mirabilis TaxID=2528011 RepID=UPI003AF3C027
MLVSSDDPEAPAGDAEAPAPTPQQRGERFEGWMRLRLQREFERVYRRGGRARGQWVTLAVAPNDLGCTRLGLSIGKRVFRRAVPRNRVRRLVREAFRLSYRDLPAGVDVIVIGSHPAIRPGLDDLRAELVQLSHEALAKRRRRRGGRSS